jgi:hypothetical protein
VRERRLRPSRHPKLVLWGRKTRSIVRDESFEHTGRSRPQ